jgi:hypothetical protein
VLVGAGVLCKMVVSGGRRGKVELCIPGCQWCSPIYPLSPVRLDPVNQSVLKLLSKALWVGS